MNPAASVFSRNSSTPTRSSPKPRTASTSRKPFWFSAVCKSRERPAVTDFQFLKILALLGTASCWAYLCPKPCWERVRQTGSYSAIFFHFLILVLKVPNGATVLTCMNLYTSQTAVLVASSAHFLICGLNNSSSLSESIIA